MARDLTDQVIVITGASSGIGAATAVACARAGMDVVLNGRDAVRLEEVARQVRATGRGAEPVAGDITDAGLNTRLLDAAAAGRLLHAHAEESQRGEQDLLRPRAGQQVQHQRDERGQHTQQEQRRQECQGERHLRNAAFRRAR